MQLNKISLFMCFWLIQFVSLSQTLTQSLRGTITDFDTKTSIPFANVIIVESDPIKGTSSNEFGEFRLDSVPLGRVTIKITAFGYQELFIPNILLESGKEKILTVELQSDVQEMEEIVIKAQNDKTEAINKMAMLSAKTFTVEETNRYAGSVNDPARMVSSFAGVVGDAEGNNDIVVRGNSPRGILWRLEGIDIPNPNHFANNGTTGGPVNMLNGSMLANSDFFSGAFAPEYGNALSGVFDVKFRQGNNEKREYSFSAGVLGIDGSLEGPFKKGYKGSYLINYRYSSLALLSGLGVLDFDGIPKYQDMSLLVKFPTKNSGTFTIVGLGGISSILQTTQNDSSKYIYSIYDFKANMGFIALKHEKILNPKMYLKSFVAYSTASNGGLGDERDTSDVLYRSISENYTEKNIKVQTIFNYQVNKKNTLQVGSTYTHLLYDFVFKNDETNTGILESKLKSNGKSDFIQSFVSWRYRLSNEFTLVSGVNQSTFLLNNNSTVEPRIALKWQQSVKNNFSLGFGMHSRLESLLVYMNNELQADGTYITHNKNLDFSKSMHFVAGYGRKFTENLYFKTEVYYQHLYNIPVENSTSSSLSMINYGGGYISTPLVNKGKGTNYGIELTLERFFNKNYYFLVTTSLYNSSYSTLSNTTYNSRFNGNYVLNFLGGKEFIFGAKKNKTIGINAKIALIGGNRYIPIDLQASISANTTVFENTKPWEKQTDAIIVPNFGITYRVNKGRLSHSFKIDIQNVSNNKARLNPYYNSNTKEIEWSTQLPLIPNIIYTIKF